jgi:hypothetical protein
MTPCIILGGLLYNSFTIGYTATNSKMMMNCKGFGRKQPVQGTILAFAWRDCAKTMKNLSRDSWCPSEESD